MHGDWGNCFDCNLTTSKCVDTCCTYRYSVHFAGNLFVFILSKGSWLTFLVLNHESMHMSLVKNVRNEDGKFFRKTNLASEEDMTGLIQDTLAKFGKIDILVNNAGTDDPLVIDGVQDISMETWNPFIPIMDALCDWGQGYLALAGEELTCDGKE